MSSSSGPPKILGNLAKLVVVSVLYVCEIANLIGRPPHVMMCHSWGADYVVEAMLLTLCHKRSNTVPDLRN